MAISSSEIQWKVDDAEFERLMQGLESIMPKKTDRNKIIRNRAKIFINAAKKSAPKSKKKHYFRIKGGQKVWIEPGNLRKSIRYLPHLSKRGNYAIGPKIDREANPSGYKGNKVNGYYAHFVEYGHPLYRMGKSFFGIRRKTLIKQEPAKPFMRPAWRSKKDIVKRLLINDIRDLIKRQVK